MCRIRWTVASRSLPSHLILIVGTPETGQGTVNSSEKGYACDDHRLVKETDMIKGHFTRVIKDEKAASGVSGCHVYIFFAVDATSGIPQLSISRFCLLTWPCYHDCSLQVWTFFGFQFPDPSLLALHQQYCASVPAQLHSPYLSVSSLSHHLITLLYSTLWSMVVHMCECMYDRGRDQML